MTRFERTVVFLLSLACGAALGSPGAKAEPLVYGIASYSFTYAPMYIAEDAGLFKKAGLDVKGVLMAGSGVEAAATIAGNLPFYVGLPQTAALAIAKGQKLETFAKISQQFPMDITVSKDVAQRLGLSASTPVDQRLQDLKGLRIAAWTPGGAADMMIEYLIGKEGWNAQKDLTLLPIGPATAMIAALDNKRIDGFVWSSPSSDEAASRLGAFILYRGAAGAWPPLRDVVFNCLIGNPDWLAAHQDEAIKIWRALDEAMDFMRTHKAQTKAMLRARLKMFSDADFEAGYANLDNMIPKTPAVGDVEAGQVEDFMKTIDPTFAVPQQNLMFSKIGAMASASH